jgi:hypothetical protein
MTCDARLVEELGLKTKVDVWMTNEPPVKQYLVKPRGWSYRKEQWSVTSAFESSFGVYNAENKPGYVWVAEDYFCLNHYNGICNVCAGNNVYCCFCFFAGLRLLWILNSGRGQGRTTG